MPGTGDPAIVDLEELGEHADGAFGGKAAGLARLIAAGVRVPPGFALAITTRPTDAWSEDARQALLARAEPLLRTGPVAVRSSAAGEDSSSCSFAGLLRSVLGVEHADDLEAAVSRCIESGASPQVLARSGQVTPLAVGVVVQQMIPARSAGVCFTVDPTGRDRAVVVEAVAGCGEDLLSGRVAPERWRAYRSGLGSWKALPDDHRGVLEAAVVCRLAGDAAALAESLGRPLDLEWTMDREGTLWWVQARPITAATSPPDYAIWRSLPGADDGPVTLWSSWNVRETMPDPILPLTWAHWREVVMPVAISQVSGLPRGSHLIRSLSPLDLVQGRVYFNMNAVIAVPLGRPLIRRSLAMMDPEAAGAVRATLDEGALTPRRLPGSAAGRFLRFVLAGLRSVLRTVPALRPERCLEILRRDAEAIAQRPPVEGLGNAELLSELYLWRDRSCRRLLSGLQAEGLAVLVFALARRAFAAHPAAQRRLATGIGAGPTTRISIAVDELVADAQPLAERFRAAGSAAELLSGLGADPAGRSWRLRLEGFLELYGHRGPREFDLGARRWRDDPSMIVELVRCALERPAEPTADRLLRLRAERTLALTEALAAATWWRRPLLRSLARLVELYTPLREAPKHYALHVFDRARRAALELGGRLVARGWLEDADQVFLLEWEELHALGNGNELPGIAATVSARRRRHELFLGQPAPHFLRSDGVPVLPPPVASGSRGNLAGLGVSPGIARGRVRFLAEPDPRAAGTGQVLVIRFADPGWTPLFPRAAALVVEIGGLMCHAAVVAREMGVPAVFGVHRAGELLRPGEMVEVDGTAGAVRRIPGGERGE